MFHAWNRREESEPVEEYLEEIGRWPVLSEEEQLYWFKLLHAGNTARQLLIQSGASSLLWRIFTGGICAFLVLYHCNLRMVVHVARQVHQRVPTQSMDLRDLVQEGNVGLIKAINKFQPGKGKFSTYAWYHIHKACRRSIAEKDHIIRLPVHATERRHEQRQLIEHVYSIEQLGCQPVSAQEEDEPPHNPAVDAFLALLKPVEMDIVTRYFGIGYQEPQCIDEIAEQQKSTGKKVERILRQALRKMRKEITMTSNNRVVYDMPPSPPPPPGGPRNGGGTRN